MYIQIEREREREREREIDRQIDRDRDRDICIYECIDIHIPAARADKALTVERKLEEVLPRSRTEWEARLATAHHVLVGVNGAGGGGGVAGGGGRQAEATENWEAVGAAGGGEGAL